MRFLRICAIACILAFACSICFAQGAPNGGNERNLSGWAQARGGPWNQPLMPLFEKAAAKHDVPLPLLLTLAYLGCSFENRGDAPTVENGFGVMALREKNFMGKDSLGEGAALLNIPSGQLKTNPMHNINAGAAVLSAYANKMKIDRSGGLDEWLEPVIKYAGLDEEYSRMFAMEVYEQLLTGLDWVNSDGERFSFPPQEIGDIDLSDLRPKSAQEVTSLTAKSFNGYYGGATWYPAASCNYSTSRYNKTTAVVHTAEGTAAGTLSWFRNCDAQGSSNYVVSGAGGVWCVVDEVYTAWTQGCANSYCISTEHEGYASSGHPAALYNASALLFRDICNRWGIPKAHRSCPPGILGHRDINACVCGPGHTDPDPGWDWNYFMQQVGGGPPPPPPPPPAPTYNSTYHAASYPSHITAGATATCWAEFTNQGTATWGHGNSRLGTQNPQDRSSPFYQSGNWINATRPSDVDQSAVAQGQVGRYTFIIHAPATPGTYSESFRLLQEGVTWFGPTITWSITVDPATGNVSGTVTRTGDGAAVPWASVVITGMRSTTADASGKYSFTGLSAASYTITASKTGYATQSASITITAGQTLTKNFALQPNETTAPSVPTNLVARPAAPTKINLTWTASTDNVGVAGYKIFRGGALLTTVPDASGYSDTAVAANTTYSYTVSAYDASGNESAQSSLASATTPVAEIIIDNPACTFTGTWGLATASPDKYGADYSFASTAVTEDHTAKWTPNLAYEGYYDVYCWYTQGTNRATNSPYTISSGGSQVTINVNQQTNGGRWILLASGRHFLAGTTDYVKLGNGTGATGSIVAADAIRLVTVSVITPGPDTVPPSAPTGLTATVVSPTQVDLAWNASTDNIGVTGYKIYRNGSYLASHTGNAYSDLTAVANVSYTYTVTAFDAAGNESGPSNPAGTSAMGEFRAMWVDAWGSGFENAAATTATLDYIQSAGCNAVFVEMRKRADAYYTSTLEPRATNVTPAAGYDPLADIVTKAHAKGMEVHAWMVVSRAWTSQTAPPHTSPDHLFNTHQDWFSKTDAGGMYDTVDGSWLDPGVPAVEDWYKSVFMEVVQNYSIDGLCLDYIRYSDNTWGYNTTAVGRYNAEFGTSGNPVAGNSRWSDWRRDQVTNVVRRIYLEAKALKPSLKVGAAVWMTAAGGSSNVLQDWDSWMSDHYLDYACPMNYTSDNNTFAGNAEDSIGRGYGHHIYIAQGASYNTISDSMIQLNAVASLGGPGVSVYDYRVTNTGTVDRTGFKNALIAGPFATQRTVGGMSWIDNPTTGMLKGQIKNGSGVALYPATVTVSTKSIKNSGTGFYGFVDLAPGVYTVTASAPGYTNATGQATIVAGSVVNVDITMGADTTAPTISNVRTENIQATNVRVLWDTNEGATSQVEYGLTTSYGSSSTLDSQYVTTHTVQLAGLTASTLYHYRVKSKDGANNLTTSGDYTFTTGGNDSVADIIIDNPQATLVGSWFTGTATTDKYGADYAYCTTAATETKTATWRPSIIVAGNYDVYVWYPQGANRSAIAPYTVNYNGGSVTVPVNQQANGGKWNLIANAKPFLIGTAGYVKVGNGTAETSMSIMADAIKLVFADMTPPSVPTNLAVTAASETQADLTWTASTDNLGVTGYKIFRDGVQIGTSTTASYSDTTCLKAIHYVFEVTAYDAAGNESGKSVAAEILMPGGDTEAPSVPEIVAVDGMSTTQIDLAWIDSTDNIEVTGYKIYRDGVQVGTSTTTSYSDTGLAEMTTYNYEVSAYDAAGNESAKSTAHPGTTLDGTPPSVPGGLTAIAASETRVNLSWTASTDNVAVTGYRVYRDGTEIAVATTNSFSDLTCAPSTTYSYQVASEDASHNLSALSTAAQVTTTQDVTPPTVPTGLTAIAVSRSQVNLSWTGSTDAVGVVGYKVYRNGANIGTSATTSYSDTTCWGNTQYTYKVSAFDLKGNESAQSGQAVVTTPSVTTIIMDNNQATYIGAWSSGTSAPDKYGADYFYGSTVATETRSATWTPPIDVSGYYDVYVWYPVGSNRATNSPFTVTWNGSQQTINVNQQATGGQWVPLVTRKVFLQGTAGSVKLGNGTGATGSIVVADAVKFVLFSSDMTVPSTPTNLTATAASPTQINLSWTASTDNVGVTGYKIYRNGVYLTSVSGRTYNNTGLAEKTTYNYKVSAYDAAQNESAQSNQASATTWETQVIVDNSDAGFTASASWATGTAAPDKYGANYRSRPTAAVSDPAQWSFNLLGPGTFQVWAWWSAGTNRSLTAPYVIYRSGGTNTVNVNQSINGGKWNLLGTYSFLAGSNRVQLSCWTTVGKTVIADAIRLVRQ